MLGRLFKDKTEGAIFFTAFLIEIAFGLYLLQRFGFTFDSLDAIYHLYIPRTVIDNGAYSTLANFGTVWLPVFHLLAIPLVSIDLLYTTGFAGTIVNALLTGGICVILYRLVGEKYGILAPALFLSNIFTLKLGATAMMEQATIFFIVLATYYFAHYWEKGDLVEFMKCSLALIIGTLTRYEVWAMALVIIFFFIGRELKNKGVHRTAYAHFPLWGIFAWLFWNLAIFRDPFAFMHHPVGTVAQAEAVGTPLAWDIAKIPALVSVSLTELTGYGWILSLLILLILPLRGCKKHVPIIIVLLSPLLLNIVTALIGFSGWLVRYVYLIMPALILTPLFLMRAEVKSNKLTCVAILVVLLSFSSAFLVQIQPLASGSSPPGEFPALVSIKAQFNDMKTLIGNEKVLMNAFHGSGIYSVLTGTSPAQIIDDYDGIGYITAMEEPWNHASYVIILKTNPDYYFLRSMNEYYGGKFYEYLFYNDVRWRDVFLEHYELVAEIGSYLVFRVRGR